MKYLKRIVIVIIVLAVFYLALALLGAKDYTVTRTQEINAPANVVWEQVSNFKNWEKWSPWVEKDSSIKNTYTGELGKVGSVMAWVGDDKLSGTGQMEIVSLDINKAINYDLSFIVPFEMTSKGGMTLEEKDGKTIVTWFDKGDIPFLMRPMMTLFIDLDAKLGESFNRGLERIDSVSQEAVKLTMANEKEIEIKETMFPANNYVAIKHKTTIAEAMTSEFYATNFEKLGMYVGETKSTFSGIPSSICYSWNETDSTTEIALAFPLEGLTKVEKEGYEFIHLNEQRAILAKNYGPYEEMYKAHIKIKEYIKEKGLKTGLVIEEYASDPELVSSPSEILTNIYYLIEE